VENIFYYSGKSSSSPYRRFFCFCANMKEKLNDTCSEKKQIVKFVDARLCNVICQLSLTMCFETRFVTVFKL
jgi:hypothetical protein